MPVLAKKTRKKGKYTKKNHLRKKDADNLPS